MKVYPKSCQFTFRTLERAKNLNDSIVGIYRKNTTQLLWKGKRKDSNEAVKKLAKWPNVSQPQTILLTSNNTFHFP